MRGGSLSQSQKERGGGLASIKQIREEVMSKIDTDSPIQVQRANDYIYDVELIRRLQKKVRSDGEISNIENGAQKYKKEHPALNQIDKASRRIRAFEKEFLLTQSPKQEIPIEKKVSLT